MSERYSCNGLCIGVSEVGYSLAGVGYPHPGCERHADPHDFETGGEPDGTGQTMCARCGDTTEAEQHYPPASATGCVDQTSILSMTRPRGRV